MNINQTQIGNINQENSHRTKRIKQREMELETEIPIWFNGKVKWISNLTYRSKCSDVIQAILSSLNYHSSEINEKYVLYESWSGVERTLKSRCRLLKLWKSWGGESQNVILTIRSEEEETIPTHILIRQQEKKLKKLRNQLKRTNQQIEKLNLYKKLNQNDNTILTYLNISRSIIRLNNQIENQEKFIFNLTNQIRNENKQDFIQNDFKQILYHVNQTFISSRKLTHLSDQLDQQINQINQDIDSKQTLLDELELDFALQENIHIDSLNDQDEIKSSETILPMKTLSVENRPRAIVEPNQSTFKSKESLSKTKLSPLSLNEIDIQETLLTKTKIQFIPFSISKNSQFQSENNNDESDTGISSINSNDEQLVTLV